MLFRSKIFAGIDVFDIEVDQKDPEKFIEAVKALGPTFGGINLEDIKAPECFEIETRLKAEMDIPVMHDDQHGTAIITSAALLNALELVNKNIGDIKLVISGAGAAAISCGRLYKKLGVKPENIVMVDRKGVVSKKRTDLNPMKEEFATDRDITTLAEAMKGADMFLGLSAPNLVSQDMVRSMNHDPMVFALANPDPEITYEDAKASRPDVIVATGRSDYPNQINNVLGFPFIFRGAIDVSAKAINDEMKLAAAHALAALAKEPVPDAVNAAYNVKKLTFGRDYFLPKALDPRLITRVAPAVAKAAIDSGVARKPITDWEAYTNHLDEIMGHDNKMMHRLTDMAKSDPKRVVFAEGNHINMLKAAVEAKEQGICMPIVLGDKDYIVAMAKDQELSLEGIEIVQPRAECEMDRRHRYAKIWSDNKQREGVNYIEACEKMVERNIFGMMMVATGDADAFVTGVYSKYEEVSCMAKEIIGIRPGYNHFATMNILTSKKGPLFIADTLINRDLTTEALISIARLTNDAVKFFAHEPVMAMLSYSNFGTDKEGSPLRVREAVDYLHKKHPDIVVDGEMQVNFALNKELRDQVYPFTKLNGKDVNTLIFPNLSAANNAYKLLEQVGGHEVIGPIQIGLNKPIHFTDYASAPRDIINIVTIAVVDAIVQEQIQKDKL